MILLTFLLKMGGANETWGLLNQAKPQSHSNLFRGDVDQ